MSPLRVLIRAGSPRDAANYRELLTNGGDLVVVGDSAGADVVLQLVGGEGDELPGPPDGGPPLLALVSDDSQAPIAAELERRGLSVLSDGVSRAQLVAALRAVASGLSVRGPSSAGRGLRAAVLSEADAEGLTAREGELLRFLGEGMGNREIALALGLSDHTVKFHLHSIYTKLGVRTRTEAVSVAVRRGLLML
jgi:DNA-binding NarL/FixJ family response regulator